MTSRSVVAICVLAALLTVASSHRPGSRRGRGRGKPPVNMETYTWERDGVEETALFFPDTKKVVYIPAKQSTEERMPGYKVGYSFDDDGNGENIAILGKRRCLNWTPEDLDFTYSGMEEAAKARADSNLYD